MVTSEIAFPLSAFHLCHHTLFFIPTGVETGTQPSQSPSTVSVAIACRSIQKIRGKYSTLVTKSCKRLQTRRIDVEALRTFLVTMCSSPSSRDGSDTVTTVIESAKSLDEIFRALGKHGLWDFLNYYLLQSIVEEFASDDSELNGMMEQYQKDLTGHILTQKIQTYLIAMSDSESSADEVVTVPNPKLFKVLATKCEANVTEHTLSYVSDLHQSLAQQFALPKCAMILHNIAEGCINISWCIPTNLDKHVTRMVKETSNKFAEEHIMRVMLEEQCIYFKPFSMESKPLLHEPKPPFLEAGPETETEALKRKVCCLDSLSL